VTDIVLNDVHKRYPNGFHAVKGLELEIAEGELLVLVGPSGCGKTTALRMVAGLEDITSGDLYIGGKRMNDVPEKDRDIAMVFQNYALYPHMTVAQNIGFSLKLARRPRAEIRERVRDAGRLLGLEELLDRRPKQLSGGQRQRVAMGRAIVRQPQVFLMDEPLSNLDAQLRVQMRGEIASLQDRLGVTTVYVTHDQVEAMTMGDRVAVLRDGLLQQVDTPTSVYDEPANLFVARFMGSPPMNLAQGSLARGDAGVELVLGELRLPLPAAVVRERGLEPWVDRDVVVGVRPEDLRGEEPAEDGVRFTAKIERIEALGASLLGYFALPAPAPRSAGVAAAIGGEVLDEAPLVGAEGATFCATFEARSGVRMGDTVDVSAAGPRLRFFDPETEEAIGR
jgi:multiple sugar transport system ATP-binding protein